MIKSKLTWCMLVLTSLWIVSDISNRLLTSTVTVNKDKNQQITSTLALPLVVPETKEAIEQSYRKWKVEAEPINIRQPLKATMSAEQQALQNGELASLYAGDNRLVLKAVVAPSLPEDLSNQAVVLIEVENLIDGDKKIEKFSVKESVFGYQLTILSNTQIQLLNDAVEPKQSIILTMYKAIAKN